MNALIIHAHPEPNSFNGALTRTAVSYFADNGHTVQVSDLYAMHFNPVSDRKNFTTVDNPTYFKQQLEELYATEHNGFSAEIRTEIEKLEWCDLLILQFPLWWFGLPAILKGWADRVLVMGRVYGRGKWYDTGAFLGKKAMLSLTTGGSPVTYGPGDLHGDINNILFPINHGILRFTGFDVLPPFVAYAPAHVDDAARENYLQEYQKRLKEIATTERIQYPSLSEYDPQTFQRKA